MSRIGIAAEGPATGRRSARAAQSSTISSTESLRVAVIGAGHVGLVTAATLASIGHRVQALDSDPEKIASLERGTPWFHEPGLSDLVRQGMDKGTLAFTTDRSAALDDAQVVFVCVGTPARTTGDANLLAVEAATVDIAHHASGPLVIVEKSTVPAGTATRIRQTVARERPELAPSIEVVSNPEFLREGSAVIDSLEPERILIGAEGPRGIEMMRKLYRPLTDKGFGLIETDIVTAELAKHACNAFLAMKISYVNALARICEKAGADVVSISQIMGSDARIGASFLDAGLGFGGFCFPKDLIAFERLAAGLGYDFGLLREVTRINEEAVTAVVEKIREALWNLEGKRIALLGLAFKPNTDDVRFSPALKLAATLIHEGASVVGYDPEASHTAKEEVEDLEIAPDPYEAATGAQCIVLCTEWAEFTELDLRALREATAYPVFVDGRNLFEATKMHEAGFAYIPTGKPLPEVTTRPK